MTERGVEAAGDALVHGPGEGDPTFGHPAAGCRQVDLVVGEAQQHPDVGSQRAEEVHLVAPLPAVGEVGRGGMVSVDDVDGEVLRPGVAVETGTQHGPVLGPRVARVGGGVHAEDAQVAGAPRLECLRLLLAEKGVSPMLNRASTRAVAIWRGERSRTSATTTGERADSSASSARPVVAWASTPWTPAGPSTYGATCVTISMLSATRECRAGAAVPSGGRVHGPVNSRTREDTT